MNALDAAIITAFDADEDLQATGPLKQDESVETLLPAADDTGRFTFTVMPSTTTRTFDGTRYQKPIYRFTGYCTSAATLKEQQRTLIAAFDNAALAPATGRCQSFLLHSDFTRVAGKNGDGKKVYQSVTDFRAEVEF
jgi:hypothetical protein